MSIKEKLRKINLFKQKTLNLCKNQLWHPNSKKPRISAFLGSDMYIVAIIVLVGLSGFGLGRLSIIDESVIPVSIEYGAQNIASVSGALSEIGGEVVVSKNGSKYHLPWCSGASRIKEENKVWFATIEEAKQAGYTPAGNCKGLK